MLSILLLAVNLLNSALAVEVVPAFNPTKLAVNGPGLPDTAPYNFMFTTFERTAFDEGYFSRFVIPINSRHKKARLVYNTNNEIIGFDLYIRGRSYGMTPLVGLDRATANGISPNFFLSFPMNSTAWRTSNITAKYEPKKFTHREKFMRNENSDFYCRFRNPSGIYSEETEALVIHLNKGIGLSFNGITNITKFSVTANTKDKLLSKLFLQNYAGKVYLDAEYEDPLILKEDVSSEFFIDVFLCFLVLCMTLLFISPIVPVIYGKKMIAALIVWGFLPVTAVWIFIWFITTLHE